jgi:hypothetical protein
MLRDYCESCFIDCVKLYCKKAKIWPLKKLSLDLKFAENLSKPNDFTNKLNEVVEGPTRGEPRSQSSRLTSHTPFMRFPN